MVGLPNTFFCSAGDIRPLAPSTSKNDVSRCKASWASSEPFDSDWTNITWAFEINPVWIIKKNLSQIQSDEKSPRKRVFLFCTPLFISHLCQLIYHLVQCIRIQKVQLRLFRLLVWRTFELVIRHVVQLHQRRRHFPECRVQWFFHQDDWFFCCGRGSCCGCCCRWTRANEILYERKLEIVNWKLSINMKSIIIMLQIAAGTIVDYTYTGDGFSSNISFCRFDEYAFSK